MIEKQKSRSKLVCIISLLMCLLLTAALAVVVVVDFEGQQQSPRGDDNANDEISQLSESISKLEASLQDSKASIAELEKELQV